MTKVSRRTCMALAAANSMTRVLVTTTENVRNGYQDMAGTDSDSLNAQAKAKGPAFGSALGMGYKRRPQVLGLASFFVPSPDFDDPQMRALFLSQCGILVRENELKWYTLRPNSKTVDFERADLLLDFARRHGLAMRGHTLLRNRTRWMPEWVNSYDFGSYPATMAERMLRAHISTVCGRYGDRIFSYDVINETIVPATGGLLTQRRGFSTRSSFTLQITALCKISAR